MAEDFIDFHAVMQTSPEAESDKMHRVCRVLATRLRPDNPETRDLDSFLVLNRAYEVLFDPLKRVKIDRAYASDRSTHAQSTPAATLVRISPAASEA